jgi:hypothetical protein
MAAGTASVVGADSYPRPVGRGAPDPEVARLAGLLTGRSIDDPRAVAELAAALQALRIFPTLAARS